MKRKFPLFKFFSIGLFLFLLLTQITFSQSANLSKVDDNLNKLNLPFSVNFSTSEIKLLNSLSSSDLEKLIRVIKLVVENNLKNSPLKNPSGNNFQNLTGNAVNSNPSTQPTTYSNSQSPQTPHYNPATGQYQSTPSSNSGGQSSNPYSNNLPFSGDSNGGTQSGLSPFAQPPQPQGALANVLKGVADGATTQGVSNEANCGGSDATGNGNDAEIRSMAAASGIGIGSVSTLQGLPKKTILALKQIKEECQCDVTITGGTSTTQHKTHGPGKAIVDLRSRDNPRLRAYTKGGRLPKGVTYLDETETGIKTALGTGFHWHIVANNYACNK